MRATTLIPVLAAASIACGSPGGNDRFGGGDDLGGGAEAGPDAGPKGPVREGQPVPFSMDFYWQSECHEDSNGDFYVNYVDNRIIDLKLGQIYFFDSECQDEQFELYTYFDFELISTSDESVNKIRLVADDSYLAPGTQAVADAFNAEQLCGHDFWSEGTSLRITGCLGTLEVGQVRYTKARKETAQVHYRIILGEDLIEYDNTDAMAFDTEHPLFAGGIGTGNLACEAPFFCGSQGVYMSCTTINGFETCTPMNSFGTGAECDRAKAEALANVECTRAMSIGISNATFGGGRGYVSASCAPTTCTQSEPAGSLRHSHRRIMPVR